MKPHLIPAVAAAAALLLSPAAAHAQATCTAQGTVLDAEGNAVADVVVSMVYKGNKPQKYKTKTDKRGNFMHVNVYEGPYDITFTKEGAGEVTVKDFFVREVPELQKAPTFRLGGVKKTAALAAEVAAAPGAPGAAPGTPAPAGPDPNAIAAMLQKAGDDLTAGRVDDAIAGYQQALAQAPTLALVHHNLGIAYRNKGDLAAAEASFRRAAEIKPDFGDAHGALSVLLAGQGKREEALAEAQEAVKDSPQNPQYWYNLGVLLRDSGKGAEARDALLKVEELDPANVEVQFQLGTVLLGLGQMPEAAVRFEKYLASAPAEAPNVGPAKGILAALKKK